jgi:hypothetical protein
MRRASAAPSVSSSRLDALDTSCNVCDLSLSGRGFGRGLGVAFGVIVPVSFSSEIDLADFRCPVRDLAVFLRFDRGIEVILVGN